MNQDDDGSNGMSYLSATTNSHIKIAHMRAQSEYIHACTASSVSYEATEALKANMVEVECKRSQTLAEARPQNLCGQ
jgi:hypothetical protein